MSPMLWKLFLKKSTPLSLAVFRRTEEKKRANAPQMAKRKKSERFSPFRVLDGDCLNVVAERVLDDLVAKPLESIRSFLSFSITTHWKPSSNLYMKIVEAFTIAGRSSPEWIIDRIAMQIESDGNRNACELAVCMICQMLQTLRPLVHPFLELPSSVDEWKHAYLFFDRMRRKDFSAAQELNGDLPHMLLEATAWCACALGDSNQTILNHCKHASIMLLNLGSRVSIANHIQSNRFLVSRCKCTVILTTCTSLWSDSLGKENPIVLELLSMDSDFLRSYNAEGIPTSHGIFIAGGACKRTFEYVVAHPSFLCNQITTLENNTIAHSLSTTSISIDTLTNIPSLHTLFDHKYYMAKRLFELYRSNRNLFCKMNNKNLQPWQLTSHLISDLVDKTVDFSIDRNIRSSFEKASNMMNEVCCTLRSCAL